MIIKKDFTDFPPDLPPNHISFQSAWTTPDFSLISFKVSHFKWFVPILFQVWRYNRRNLDWNYRIEWALTPIEGERRNDRRSKSYRQLAANISHTYTLCRKNWQHIFNNIYKGKHTKNTQNLVTISTTSSSNKLSYEYENMFWNKEKHSPFVSWPDINLVF